MGAAKNRNKKRRSDSSWAAQTRPGNLLQPAQYLIRPEMQKWQFLMISAALPGSGGASGQCKAKVWPLQHLRNSAKNPVAVTEEVTLAYSLPLRKGFVVCKSRVRKVVQMQESCRKFGQLPHNHRYYRHNTHLCQGPRSFPYQRKGTTYQCSEADDWKLRGRK